MRLLIIEDELPMRTALCETLAADGYKVRSASDGETGLERALSEEHDLILLDVMMPKLDGYALCRELRRRGRRTPVLMLTAKGMVDDRVDGLDAGADDYLVKPFASSELLARVSALGRRQPISETVTRLAVSDLELDLLKRTVTRAGTRIELQQQEYKLLEYLMRHAGEIVTRTMLLENIWSFHFDPGTNLIESHISRLRAKIDRGFDLELIQTVRGAGYRMRGDD